MGIVGAWGHTRDQLVLDNGVVLTGSVLGGGFGGKSSEIRRIRLVDVEEAELALYPKKTSSASPDVDAAIMGIVSSRPLGYGACSNGVARPGYPFSFRDGLPTELNSATWSTGALRLHHEGVEVTLVPTSGYWRSLVDLTALQHNSIIGIRRSDGGVLQWSEIERITSLLSNFLGWVNHCRSPVFHIKGYRGRRLVYRGYDLHPHATVGRDGFSWLPMFGLDEEDTTSRNQVDLIQRLFEGFAAVWTKNEAEQGVFHIALDMLRSRSKGSARHKAAIGYLRDTFGACGILIGMLIGAGGRRRRDVIWECLRQIGVEDELPLASREDWNYVVHDHSELWAGMHGHRILENEKGTLSRALSNVEELAAAH